MLSPELGAGIRRVEGVRRLGVRLGNWLTADQGRRLLHDKAKHGIDFVEAQALWVDPDRLELPARPTDEPRFLIVGQITQDLWTAAVTYRHEETIRLISVRRARDGEKRQYVDAREGRHEARHDHG